MQELLTPIFLTLVTCAGIVLILKPTKKVVITPSDFDNSVKHNVTTLLQNSPLKEVVSLQKKKPSKGVVTVGSRGKMFEVEYSSSEKGLLINVSYY